MSLAKIWRPRPNYFCRRRNEAVVCDSIGRFLALLARQGALMSWSLSGFVTLRVLACELIIEDYLLDEMYRYLSLYLPSLHTPSQVRGFDS